MNIKAKKHLGQHFLADLNIAHKIVEAFCTEIGELSALEIGPGKGILTKILLEKNIKLSVSEIDRDCIAFLTEKYPNLTIYPNDFLKMDLQDVLNVEFGIIGNFPYNISSQILFKTIDNRLQIPVLTGMFQKEVAERIMAKHGNKTYGILSVITQAYYDVEYLFTVNESVFVPPPKVKSAVITIKRKEHGLTEEVLPLAFFKKVVKMAFNHRRKTMKNSLRPFYNEQTAAYDFWSMRPEQLSVEELISLAKKLYPIINNNAN
jgi:16S rRNA (adenine1518-N6/adenine1519-N6)-dimethyltransferase